MHEILVIRPESKLNGRDSSPGFRIKRTIIVQVNVKPN
jgi:hypothetical protein